MVYVSQDKWMEMRGYRGGRVLVKYHGRGKTPVFEFDAANVKAALEYIDLVRRYDGHLEVHRYEDYHPTAELLQRNEEGEWENFGAVGLPGEPPWARPRRG